MRDVRSEEIAWYVFLAIAGFVVLTRWQGINTIIATEGAGVESFTSVLQGGSATTGY